MRRRSATLDRSRRGADYRAMGRWLEALVLASVVSIAACGGSDISEGGACYSRDLLTNHQVCDLLGDACTPAEGDVPGISAKTDVVPGPNLPEGVTTQNAHNNLDAIWYQDRLFLAFRAAPNHFASDEVVMYVISTEDLETWVLEATYDLDTDLREPRFLSFDGRLFLYFAVLGRYYFEFNPEGSRMSELLGPCRWTEPVEVLPDGMIAWRTKTIDGVPYLLGYVGGDNIYDGEEASDIQVYWLTTTNGRDFEPVIRGRPVVIDRGGSETDFVFLDDGTLIAVSRNEGGDETGFGSKLCRADPGFLANWRCVSDPKKYDSPLMFRHGDGVYLIGRRNVTDTGDFDLGRDDLPFEDRFAIYNLDYWQQPKRCALWRVDPDTLAVDFVLDLPSAGDTCFPALVPLNDTQYLVFNYSSPLDDLDIGWIDGQIGPTFIYRVTLTMPAPR